MGFVTQTIGTREKYMLLEKFGSLEFIDLLSKRSAYLAGGAIRSVYTSARINDYDIYFTDEDGYYSTNEHIKSIDVFQFLGRTDNAITYKNTANEKLYQLIIGDSFIGSPEDIMSKFDFTICQGAYNFKTQEVILSDKFLEHNSQKRLVYTMASSYPLSSLVRMKKYIKYGYEISGTEIVKIALAINDLNMKTYHDLKKQLEGVDTLLLKSLTSKMGELPLKEAGFNLSEFIFMMDRAIEDKFDDMSE